MLNFEKIFVYKRNYKVDFIIIYFVNFFFISIPDGIFMNEK